MSIIPILKSKEVVRILLKAGFKIIRQTGSHIRLEHESDPTRKVTIPFHGGDVPRNLLFLILKQAGISIQEFLEIRD